MIKKKHADCKKNEEKIMQKTMISLLGLGRQYAYCVHFAFGSHALAIMLSVLYQMKGIIF